EPGLAVVELKLERQTFAVHSAGCRSGLPERGPVQVRSDLREEIDEMSGVSRERCETGSPIAGGEVGRKIRKVLPGGRDRQRAALPCREVGFGLGVVQAIDPIEKNVTGSSHRNAVELVPP